LVYHFRGFQLAPLLVGHGKTKHCGRELIDEQSCLLHGRQKAKTEEGSRIKIYLPFNDTPRP
jgi:hypothetical protein